MFAPPTFDRQLTVGHTYNGASLEPFLGGKVPPCPLAKQGQAFRLDSKEKSPDNRSHRGNTSLQSFCVTGLPNSLFNTVGGMAQKINPLPLVSPWEAALTAPRPMRWRLFSRCDRNIEKVRPGARRLG